MDEDALDRFERDAELSLFQEYRDVASQFRYIIETDRRFYLANEVNVTRHDAGRDFYFEIQLQDVWVWDIYRSDRFVKAVKVITYKDVNIEELRDQELQLPDELSLDDPAA